MRKLNWLSKLLCLCLLIAVFAISVSAAENTTEFAGGEGTEVSPYLIANATHLNNVRNYPDAHFKMTADIVFTDADFAEGGAFYNDGSGWTPMGTNASKEFTGIFNGAGHTITGLKQNISASSTTYGGLFGCVSGATIKNLGLVGADISVTNLSSSSRAYAGGIAGFADDSTISNCYNTGAVTATISAWRADVGGIVGYAERSIINNCYNTGGVKASASAYNAYAETGGIVGFAYDSTISNCYNTGAVSASPTASCSYAYAGGIAGVLYANTISNCYNIGAMSATVSLDTYSYAYTGGISGYVYGKSTISNCYNAGTVTASVSSSCADAGGIAGDVRESAISNCYYLDTASIGVGRGTDTAAKCTSEEMKCSSTFANFDFIDTWTMAGKSTHPYPELQYVGMAFAGGSGTDTDPFLIATKAHLNAVSDNLGAHYKMIADIVFAEADFAEGGAFYNDGAGWVSIGNDETPFMGFFDGDGHTIKGIKQNIVSDEDVCGGLFGCASNATIKNVGMLDSDISIKTTDGYVYAGGVVGYLSVSTIKNCHNTGTVTAASLSSSSCAYAGGIAGCVYGGSTISECDNTGKVTTVSTSSFSYVYAATGGIVGCIGESTVSNCYNTGAVTADSSAGGIAGYAADTAISNCYNTGTVSGDDAGGIAGSAIPDVIISNCYNTGTAKADDHAGGIVGWAEYHRTISNCYNTGAVSGGYAGGIAGYVSGQINYDTIKDCYYLDNCSVGVGVYEDAGTKCTAAQMKLQATFSGFDFSNTWTMEGDEDYPYPELVALVEKPAIHLSVTPNVVNNHIVLFVKSNKEISTQVLHIALYSEAGQMLDYIIVPTIEPFKTTNVVFDDDATVKTAKVFLWDSLTTTTPIADAVEVTIR